MRNILFVGTVILILMFGSIAANQSSSQSIEPTQLKVKKVVYKKKPVPSVIAVIIPKADSISMKMDEIEAIHREEEKNLIKASSNADVTFKGLKKILAEDKADSSSKRKESLEKTLLPIIDEMPIKTVSVDLDTPSVEVPQKTTLFRKFLNLFPFNKKR